MKAISVDPAGDLGRHLDLAHRGQRADPVEVARHRPDLGRCGRDRGRRRHLAREEVGDRLGAEPVEGEQPAADQGQQQRHDHEPDHHPPPRRLAAWPARRGGRASS